VGLLTAYAIRDDLEEHMLDLKDSQLPASLLEVAHTARAAGRMARSGKGHHHQHHHRAEPHPEPEVRHHHHKKHAARRPRYEEEVDDDRDEEKLAPAPEDDQRQSQDLDAWDTEDDVKLPEPVRHVRRGLDDLEADEEEQSWEDDLEDEHPRRRPSKHARPSTPLPEVDDASEADQSSENNLPGPAADTAPAAVSVTHPPKRQDAAARGPQRTTAAAATATAAPAATAAAATAAGAPGPVQAGGSGRSWLLPCFGWAIVLVVVILIALRVKRPELAEMGMGLARKVRFSLGQEQPKEPQPKEPSKEETEACQQVDESTVAEVQVEDN